MRVLVVEDDAALGEVVARGLREEGHAVDVEGTIAGAELALGINAYDLMVLDLGLPDGDGLALCRRAKELDGALRRQPVRDGDLGSSAAGDTGDAQPSPVRVLVLTARDTLPDKVSGLDAGADDYLTKPFDFPELTARVRALLRRPVASGSTILVADDLRLDPASHRVWRGAVLTPLTAREFSLLHYLMSRQGEVVSRTDLLEHVWDTNYDGLSNVVDVHIASLRRKLDVPGSPAPIETLRGVGYRVTM